MTDRTFRGRITLLLVAAAALATGGYALADTASVQLTASGPQPPVLKIGWGDTVTFQNADSAAVTIVSGQSDFNSSALPPGATYQKVFDGKVGKYPYRVTKPKDKGGVTATHGTVVVAMTGQLTLSAKPTAAAYGKSVTLQGTTTLTAHPVTIQQKTTSAASKGWTDVVQLTPSSDGTFVYAAKPIERTSYRATQADGQLVTAGVSVRVAPVVTMKVSARNARAGAVITVTARVQPAAASSAVLLLASEGHGWKQVGRAKLQSNGTAKLRFAVPDGQVSLRAVVKPPLVRPGFEPAQSVAVPLAGANAPAILQFQVFAPPAKGKHSSVPDLFSTRSLHAKPGKVTLIMKNLGRGRHGLAISGPGVLLKGPVVGHGGISRVTATLRQGTYIFYSFVGSDQRRGEAGRLVVRP